MKYTSTLTKKGQVTIPIEIRKYLGLKPHDKVAFTIDNKQVSISRAKDSLSKRGSVKNLKRYSELSSEKEHNI